MKLQKNIFILIASLTLICGLFLSFQADGVHAEETSLELKILPINCVFETTNDGLNTITYITPEECGQYVAESPLRPQSETVSGPNRDRTNGTILNSQLQPAESQNSNEDGGVNNNLIGKIAGISTTVSKDVARHPLTRVAAVMLLTAAALIPSKPRNLVVGKMKQIRQIFS